ncbi:MAG: stage 0 sporulation protein [bacterium]|nr:stage 0 sporulation protein [bacterium]
MHVVDVKIREHRYIARFRGEDIPELQPRTLCLVESEGDLELAKIKTRPYEWNDELPPEETVYYHGPVSDEDLNVYRENHKLEKEAFQFALNRVRDRQLDMALAAVERSFDCKKLRFFFTAEQRIDFRDLVKDLASEYKTRIEMRQIGVRDRSKKIGGYGICGQELCCSRFLRKFEPITIRMAKEQNLALNPSKISGLCGRLMCCLSYEVSDYAKARREALPLGARVSTPFGEGVTTDFNYVRNTMNVHLDDSKTLPFRIDELVLLSDPRKKKKEKES